VCRIRSTGFEFERSWCFSAGAIEQDQEWIFLIGTGSGASTGFLSIVILKS